MDDREFIEQVIVDLSLAQVASIIRDNYPEPAPTREQLDRFARDVLAAFDE